MPYGLPAATVVVTSEVCRVVDSTRQVMVCYQDHIEPLYRGADQDGWAAGEVICRYKGDKVAVPPRCLRLG